MLTPSDCQCGHAHGDEPETDENDEEQDQNPLPVLIVFVIANTVFVTVGGLLRLLAQLLTLPGLLVALLLALVLGIRRVASLMAYPGQLKLVIREGEANFARLTKRRLQIFAEAAAELAAVLDPTSSNKPMRLRFLQVHQNFTFALETLMLPVMQSLEIVERDGNLGTNGAKLLRVLREIGKVNTQKLAEPCSKLCSASEKAFEMQRLKMFGEEKEEPVPVKTAEPARKKLFGGASKPVLKRSTTVDSASLEAEAAAKAKPVDAAHPLVTFAVAELCRGSTPEVDYIATLEMLRADMTVRFKAEQVWILGYQGHQVDAMLMPPASSGRDAVDRPVVVLCNPNGGLYEFHHLQMDWIKFYTSDLDCHVLVYNYRGERGMKKIAVHGESIGGLVATYVAHRTFATVPALAQRMIAKWAGTVVDWVMRWETNNVQNYLEATCAKLLCSDPCDEIILDGASLKSGVALSVELGEKTFSLPRQRETDGSPVSPSSATGFLRKTRGRCGPRSIRRVSEAASRPQLGEPLTETMVARFSEAVLSVGRRAFEYTARRDKGDAEGYSKGLEEAEGSSKKTGPATAAVSSSHVTISVDDAEASATTATCDADNEHHPMLSTDATVAPAPVTTSAAFPDELLAVVWMQLARLDGYCGQCLLQAAENGGYDKIRAWTASLLTWGGRVAPERRTVRSLEPFDRDGIFIVPTTVAEVHAMLQHLVEQYPPLKFDYDIGFLVLMVEYLHDALQRRWRHLDSTKTNESDSKTPDSQGMESISFNCQLAALGAYLPKESEDVKVVLAPGGEMLACSPFVAMRDREVDLDGAAVVVRRGECSFLEKLTHVAATGAAFMILVNSEEALIALSSLEYERSTTASVSVTLSDGERLIQLVKDSHRQQVASTGTLTAIRLRVSPPVGLVGQAHERLQFLVDINAPVAVYEEYLDAAEQLEPLVGTLDELLAGISTEGFNQQFDDTKLAELVEFFSWCARQLSKWGFASQAALHASVAAAVLQLQLLANDAKASTGEEQRVIQAATRKLTECGYYSHSAFLLQRLVETSQGRAVGNAVESPSREFSSKFTKELFDTLVMMGVFLDELGPFDESLRFFSYASRLCEGDRITLERLEERVISPLGNANTAAFSEPRSTLRPEAAAYLRYTITPPTMFIGYQGINVLPIQRAVNELRSIVYPSLSSSFNPKPVRSSPSGAPKLRRVGFISTWFRVHSVGKLLLSVIENLDRAKFHVAIYRCMHFLRDSDEITQGFKRTADDYVELPESQDAAVQILRQAHLDVAVFPELGMDEWTVLLSHHRVAPIQCVFWGHPITTGNPQIDYFISSEHFVSKHFDEPVEEPNILNQLSGYRRASFSEQIVLFRGLSTAFTEPKPLTAESKDISRSRLHLPPNRRLYVCPQVSAL
uniref:PA domain-containing protein n=1 Tax=Phytophthora ramorum TaxID=164328 RepID=H3GWZ6_PHYRM